MRYYMQSLAALAVVTIAASQNTGNAPNFLNRFTSTPPVIYTPGPTTPSTTTSTTTPSTPTTAPGYVLAASCTTAVGLQGHCVSPLACQNGVIVTTGNKLIVPRASSVACAASQVCCQPPSGFSPPTTPTTTTTTTTRTVTAGPPSKLGCGQLNSGLGRSGIGRAGSDSKGVTVANFGEYPWAVPIFELVDGAEDYLGGGSLIHPRLVLTIASKFTSGGNFLVKAGDWDITGNYELYGSQSSNVAEVISHNGFNSGRMSNNIALLLLATAITANTHNVGYACLPTATTNTAVGTRCFATGWGFDFAKGIANTQPKKMQLPIVERIDCQTRLRKAANPNMEVGTSNLCAGGEAQVDTCRGDGGSPLMCPYPGLKNQVYVAGMVSFGLGCGEAGMPAVYTDVAALRPWIDQQVAAKGLESSYYTP